MSAPPEPPRPPYRGSDPFEAPPSAPVPLVQTPARPPGSDPSPADLASYPPYCGQATECGVCNNWGRCGFCMATKKCVPKDKYGAFPSSCSAGFTPNRCASSLYIAKEEPRLHERYAALMRGLAPEGTPIDARVDGAKRILRIPVARGYCYGLVVRTSYEVEDTNGAEVAATPEASFVGDGGYWTQLYTGAWALTPFCPQEAGAILVRVTPSPGTTGTWRAQLFRKPVADDALRAQAEKLETQRRQSVVRYVCGHCAKVLLVCRLNGDPECTATYAWCLKQGGLRADDCERGDVPRPPPDKPKAPYDVSVDTGSDERGG